jgi:hypothetical protein
MGPLKMHEKSHLTNLTSEVMLLTSGASKQRKGCRFNVSPSTYNCMG